MNLHLHLHLVKMNLHLHLHLVIKHLAFRTAVVNEVFPSVA